jgi:N6-adenosine-specific RNA methylase IME4
MKAERPMTARYGCIVADPPWAFATYSAKGLGKSPQRHYSCMTLAEIMALPVADMAAPDCVLFLWATNPMLPEALETARAWGFAYKSARTWNKTTASGKEAFGAGYWLRSSSEHLLIGTRGKPAIRVRNVRSSFSAPVREHSRKPDIAYADAMRMAAGPYLEMFSRETRPGWDAWGDQTGLFDEVAA